MTSTWDVGKEDQTMTRAEMYELLKQKQNETNWNSIDSVHAYNEYARFLREMVEEEED